jgi:hypothetical protein
LLGETNKVPCMPSPGYYRRQSVLCLQLALLQNDPRTKLLLAELAKQLQAKADGARAGSDATEAETHLKPPDPPPRRRAPESRHG